MKLKFVFLAALSVLSCLPQVTQSCGCSQSGDGMASMPGMSSVTTSQSSSMSMSMSDDSYWDEVGGGAFESNGNVRHYYIQSEEVIWDYAPDGYDVVNGSAWGPDAIPFVTPGPGRIGSKYIKCLYFEYTDGTFTKKKERAPEDEYLGFLGPTIYGEVGDAIKIIFSNKCSFSASVHPHGVFYDKTGEGAPYNDTTSGRFKKDDFVEPNTTYTYTWLVPGRAGPGPMDGSTAMWMYHSHTIEDVDYYSGLIGFLVITKKGKAKPDGRPKDVERDIFMLFTVMNEAESHYYQQNLAKFAQPSNATQAPGGFGGPSSLHSINGYIYGNGPMATMKKHQRVRWYVMSMGGVRDTHTPHWHGNILLTSGMRMDIVGLAAGEMMVLDMKPDNTGIWLYHCHVNEHLRDGMVTRYEVIGSNEKFTKSKQKTGLSALY